MTSGGARARSGPAPDPNALRRSRDQGSGRQLLERRDGPPPAWPLARVTARERILWAIEWTRPQAVVWEAEGQELEVALFVRAVAAAERSKATAADRGLVLRYMDDLGISRAGMARNRWTIGQADPVDDARHAPAPPAGSSAKARLRALDGGAA